MVGNQPKEQALIRFTEGDERMVQHDLIMPYLLYG